jgi:hypothetical protein
MKVELWVIERIKPYPNNPRLNDDAVEAVEEPDWRRRVCVGHDRRRRPMHRPEGYELSPWQENAIRAWEDQS